MNNNVVWARTRTGAQAFLFIIAVLAGWWLFASLANNVARCVPWGPTWGECRPRGNTIPPPATGLRPLSDRTENALLIVSLFPALWAAHRLLYSSQEDAGQKPVRRQEPGPLGRVA